VDIAVLDRHGLFAEFVVTVSFLPQQPADRHRIQDMAQGNAKRIAQQNASTLALLRNGFLFSQVVQLVSLFLFKASRTKIVLYIISSLLAGVLGLSLNSMGQAKHDVQGKMVSAGDDLSSPGLTAYMFDVVYITWAVHVLSAISIKFYYFYFLVPGYAFFKAWTLVLQPRFFPSRPSVNQKKPSAVAADKDEGLSKKQKKLQERYKAGDKRVVPGRRP